MKGIITSIAIVVVLIFGAMALRGNNVVPQGESIITEGPMSSAFQIVEIKAKGGYSPRLVTAKAGIPTTLKVATNGTFDCSSALTIPKLGYQVNLPASGVTEVEIPPQSAGTTLQGTCSMGMYDFAIKFE